MLLFPFHGPCYPHISKVVWEAFRLSKKILSFILLAMLLVYAASAEGREIALQTRVLKWGQMPVRFEIAGQALPEGVTAADFVITGQAAGWENNGLHAFSCGVEALEAAEGGWALIPELFPEKFFYVREMAVECAAHPELGFALEDIGSVATQTADEFDWVEEHESRLTARVFLPPVADRLPVVLVFHGYGDSENLLSCRTAVAWAEPGQQAVRPCIVIAPVINNTFYGSDIARSRIYEGIKDYIDGLVEAGLADPGRVYVMGNSFGGMASFEIAEQYPGYFAAILALCPALNYSRDGTARLSTLTDIPVTIAQAEGDETIPSEIGRRTADALAAAGNGNVTLRLYTDAEMIAAGAVKGYEQTYSFHHVELAVMEDEAYAQWLFDQRYPSAERP